ncbi:MAG: pyridoxal-dependent decarboxylase, partial [Candidatus Sericytochromatia bacterium]|nr:pyridoxal-dependent decarboxylase [Candidatus Tanganyikabacteria bacterium]
MTGLQAAYDPEAFRRAGHQVIDRLADYLAGMLARPETAVLPWVDPDAQVARWETGFPAAPADDAAGALDALIGDVLAAANHLHHPRYIGHQVAVPLPSAALGELAGALLNNSMAVYEMGPVGTALEKVVVRWLAAAIGLRAGADGVLCCGGSIGNLTALLAARAHSAPEEGERLALLTSEQTHYSVRRAAQVMGWGDEGVFTVAADGRFRLDPADLQPAFERARDAGRRVVAVVGSACSTATGAYDPLDAIADFAAERGLWFHVDGAHGASAALSRRYRHLVAGIERADSVVWDAHKLMMLPSLITAVLFRDGAHSYETFSQQASYLFERRPAWYNLAERTLECTKRSLSLPVYAALKVHGTDLFATYVERTYDLAREFASAIAAAPDFELAVEPQSNIV